MRVPRRNSPPKGLEDKSEETVIVGTERLTICKRVAIARQYPFDHRLLREMQKDSFAKRFCSDLGSGGIFQRGLDPCRHRARDVARGRGNRTALPPFGFRSRQPWSLQNPSSGNYLHFSA